MSILSADGYTTFETAHGTCAIAWNDQGIACLQLPTHRAEDIRRWRHRRIPEAHESKPDGKIAAIIGDAVRYFAGEQIVFDEVAVDLAGQSEFFTAIYQALRSVPYGQTTTYGTLAKQLGAGPEMARDVGVAMATNPVPLIIPCHRVLAAGGKLGGFSAPGGATAKQRMLELEKSLFAKEAAPVKAPPPQQAFNF